MVAFVGTGNMSGQIEIFSCSKSGWFKVSETQTEHKTQISWSPDGKNLLFSTLTPILNVSNGFEIRKYNSKILHSFDENKLYSVVWRPGKFKYSPPSPRGLKEFLKIEKKDLNVSKEYIPPHLRKL
jgi:translation initiation factor 2A